MKKLLFVLFVCFCAMTFMACKNNVVSSKQKIDSTVNNVIDNANVAVSYVERESGKSSPLTDNTADSKVSVKPVDATATSPTSLSIFVGSNAKTLADYITIKYTTDTEFSSKFTPSTCTIDTKLESDAEFTSLSDALDSVIVRNLSNDSLKAVSEMAYTDEDTYFFGRMKEAAAKDAKYAIKNTSLYMKALCKSFDSVVEWLEDNSTGRSEAKIKAAGKFIKGFSDYLVDVIDKRTTYMKGDLLALELATTFMNDNADILAKVFKNNLFIQGSGLTASQAETLRTQIELFDKVLRSVGLSNISFVGYVNTILADVK